ncbi:MAG TPA: hypothetical protein VM537_07495 [Anaerolineae bacterium]|nr:hypothetical protein [Anaerolineae bacterium]
MSLVLFSCDERRVVSAQDDTGQWYALVGQCLRCGQCCKDKAREQLGYETLDGERQAVCAVHWTKPWHCAVYPREPQEPLLEGCGYRWEPE